MHVTKDLVAASAIPLALGVLAKEGSYGYAILEQVNELSSGQLEWSDGLLYPLLHRLERLGYGEPSWRAPEGGCRRKYERITEQGRAESSVGRCRRRAARHLEHHAGCFHDPGFGMGGVT